MMILTVTLSAMLIYFLSARVIKDENSCRHKMRVFKTRLKSLEIGSMRKKVVGQGSWINICLATFNE